MAKARALVKRRKAVGNIRKICRTMQLIATARYQKALRNAQSTRPYTEKVRDLVERLSGLEGQFDHPLLRVNEGTGRHALLVITSNRGLCGGYNASVLRAAMEHHETAAKNDIQIDFHVVGIKGIGYFRFLGHELAKEHREIGDSPSFADAQRLSNSLIDLYSSGAVDSVHVAYMKFITSAQQRPTVIQLMPARAEELADSGETTPKTDELADYEYSPEPDELLSALLPLSIQVQTFQCLNDAVVSEQVARMVAMKSATDAAGDMIKSLTQQYNRARQTQITTELLEIMGGAEALAD
jgi:F-type H+-transporting ATPase subunit gamma